MHTFKSGILRAVFPAGLVLMSAIQANAQLPQTQLSALSPPGGKAGTTFDVKVSSGANLEDLNKLVLGSRE